MGSHVHFQMTTVEQMISDITGICMVFHQYGFSCAFSDDYLQQMISDITGICMVFPQYGFSCAFSDYYL